MPSFARWLCAVAFVLAVIPPRHPAEAGGVPEKLPPDWVTVGPGPGAEIVEFIQKLPHDPNLLGVRAAHLRDTEYSQTFAATRLFSLDGTPLAGRWAVIYDDKPRPGVVLVPGTPQGKDKRFMVEVAHLFWRNGWHVLAIDQRGDGESRRLSPALMTDGLKEWEDVLAAVRALRSVSKATSIAVVGFSSGGVALVKAMGRDPKGEIAAGIAVTAPIAPRPAITPPPPDWKPNPLQKWFLDRMGATSFHEYYQRAARMYGVDLQTLHGEMRADLDILQVKAPLLMLYTLDDGLMNAHVKAGRHDGGPYSLAFRDTVKDHPSVRALVLDRGGHAGILYLSDPHWFGLATLGYLKHWQARDVDHVTRAVPPLDVLAEGALGDQTVTYRFVVRNHGTKNVGPLDVFLDMPEGGRLTTCWAGVEGLGRCTRDGNRLTWTIPRVSGGKTTAGPFVATVDVSTLKPGTFAATVAVGQKDVVAQEVTLEKK
jgi:predicted alpha/beta-fold hydrolase